MLRNITTFMYDYRKHTIVASSLIAGKLLIKVIRS